MLLLIFFTIQVIGQDALQKGNQAFEEDHFREALIYYNRIERIESSAPILFKRGVCYYEINQLDKAIRDFQKAWEYGFKDERIDYYTGLIQHHKGNFALAANYYKKYLQELDEHDVSRQAVRKLIRQCGQAIDLSFQRPLAIIEQLPGGVNTAYDEVGLLESPTREGRYYFSSNKPNTSSTLAASDYDVYWTENIVGEWSEPKRLKYTVNKRDHDVLLGFTQSANGLYLFRGKDFEGNILRNTGSGDKSRTETIKLPFDPVMINSDVFFFDDQVVLFSSRDLRGYGGYDLYASVKKEGVWSEPKNLGPKVNSRYDEISPYLSFDGSQLYYSSNRSESIGGFDIFYCRYLYEADKWSDPENMGIPINAPGDDTHFSLSYDGLTGLLSSDRKNAFGGKDLYIARFKESRGSHGYVPEVIAFLDYEIPEYEVNETMTFEDDTELSDSIKSEGKYSVVDKGTNTEIAREPEIGKQTFIIQPLYYSSGLDLINPENIDYLNAAIRLMAENPALEVTFTGHTKEEGILEYKLYASLKIAERLEKYFVERGIREDRIHVKGSADNYPVALPENEGGDYKYADKYNARVEVLFSNYDPDIFYFERQEPEIPEYTADLRYDIYSTLMEDAIMYRIQIAMVSQMYRGLALDLFNDAIVEEDNTTGLYIYSIGLYDNYNEALQVKRDMDRLGITDAQVNAYYNGKRLSADQFVYHVNEFPDLRNLMNFRE